MPRKRKKLKEKQTNQLPTQSLKINPSENKLLERLSNLTRGLFYISETDAEIMPFIGDKTPCLTQAEILRQTKSAADAPVAELIFTDFFSRLTKIQDWYGEEEKEIAQKFARLKEFLEQNLKDLKVFKIGRIELDVYIVGLDDKDQIAGIKTKAVET